MKKKPRKERYRVKKLKQVDRPPYLGSRSSSSSAKNESKRNNSASSSTSTGIQPADTITQNPTQETPNTEEFAIVEIQEVPGEEIRINPTGEEPSITMDSPTEENDIVQITEEIPPAEPIERPTSSNTPQRQVPIAEESTQDSAPMNPLDSESLDVEISADQPQLILNFREEEINVTEGYSFDEFIPFVINTNILLYPDEATEKIQELAELMIENPQVKVTIIANTATDEPHFAHNSKYGSDEETLTTMWESVRDSSDVTNGITNLKELMTARGKRVGELLIERGVNPDQLSYRHGAHFMWKYQRVLNFVLTEEE